MTDLAKLTVKLEAQTAKYQKDLERANSKLDRFARNSSRAGRVAGTALKVGALGAAAAVLTLATRAVTAGDRLDKLSIRLGDSVENLSRFEFAAERTGVKTTTLNTGLQRLVRRVDEVAKTGKGEAKVALDELGLSAQRLGKLAPTDQMLVLADAFEGVEDQSTRVRLAMKLFDTEGVALIQTLDGGQAAVRGLLQESDRLGGTLRTQTAKQAAVFRDRLTDIQAAASGVGNALITATLPAINKLSQAMLDAQPSLSGYIKFYSEALQRTERFVASGRINQIKDNLAGLRGELDKLADPRRGVELLDVIRLGGRDAAVVEKREEIEALRDAIREGEAELSKELASFNKLMFGPPAKQRGQDGGLSQPNVFKLDDFRGSNPGPKESGSQGPSTTEIFAEETDRIVDLNKQRFARIREQRLAANGQFAAIEQERFQSELSVLTTQEETLRQRLESKFNMEQEFNDARADAFEVHQARMADIEAEGAYFRDRLVDAQLESVERLFGGLQAIAGRNKSLQRALFATEKSVALARAYLNMQVSIAQAAASVPPPANAAAILAARLQGIETIVGIAATTISGARADGGPVAGGSTYLVGERGPELFTPSAAGSITPNEALGGGITVQLIEDSSRGGQVERDGNLVRVMVDSIRGELSRDVAQGRGFAEVLQGTYGLRRGARA